MPDAGKPYHHGDLRAALLARAEDKLATEGAHSLSLRQLAREVGVSHGAPRQHFRNKQALLDALAENGFDRLGQELEAAMAGNKGSFTESLTVFAQTYVRFASRHPVLLDLMYDSLHRPGADPRLRQANDRAFVAPTALIENAQADGDIVANDPDRVAMAVLAALQGLAWLVTSRTIGDRPVDAVVAGTIETLTYGLKPSDSSANRTQRPRAHAPTVRHRRAPNELAETAKLPRRKT
jgi:AcrR family transcriptional regulator